MTKTKAKEPKVNQLFEQLKAGVEKITSSEQWKQILLVQSKFHNYSFKNVMLISMQCPTATRVASYTDWKKLKRQVVKGAKSIKIMAPHKVEIEDPETGETTEKLGFHQASVFDISDTEGEELPRLKCEELTKDTQAMRDFYKLAKSICPIPVKEKVLKDGIKGYYHLVDDYIAIKKGMAAHQKCKTLIHEMAHATLHRLDNKEARSLTGNDREIEAEGTAFVVMSYFGFDTSEYSFPYVASWNNKSDLERIERAGATIQKAAAKIINQLSEEMNKEEDKSEIA